MARKTNLLSDDQRAALVTSIDGFIWRMANYYARKMRYNARPHDFSTELHSAGKAGAYEAAVTFRPELGFKFTTYAERRIKWSMRTLCRQEIARGFKKVPHDVYPHKINKLLDDDKHSILDFLTARVPTGLSWSDAEWDDVIKVVPGRRNRDIVTSYFRKRLTYSQLAEQHNVSKERIRQVIEIGLRYMRNKIVREDYVLCQ